MARAAVETPMLSLRLLSVDWEFARSSSSSQCLGKGRGDEKGMGREGG